MDETIKTFLSERKADRIKKKTKANTPDEERVKIEQDACVEFALENWLPKAANRARQLSMTTHPGKFSHPSAKVTPVIAVMAKENDGYLRTGNVHAPFDVLGNAAVIDVYKFLSLKLKNGETILKHIEENTSYIQEEFRIDTASFESLRDGFLAIKHNEDMSTTSGRVKQVYFPCEDGYHLLSILTPSGVMFALRDRIDNLRFSDQAKTARGARRNNTFDEKGFDELFDLTVIGYGGTKPQNISVLNNQNGGKAYLLPSVPPSLSPRNVQPPKRNFFINTVRPRQFSDLFVALHGLIVLDYNNINIREGRDKIIQSIIDRVLARMWSVRQIEPGWSDTDAYGRLPAAQKIWLDSSRQKDREHDEDWLDEIIFEFSRWIRNSYGKALGGQARMLGDIEVAHFKTIIEANREGLR